MIELRRLTYDLNTPAPAPRSGQFLVSLGKKGIGTVYHILTVRLVKSKDPARRRYALGVFVAMDMLPDTVFDGQVVTVRGEPALPLYWYPRNRKKKPGE